MWRYLPKWINCWCAGVHKQDYPTLSNSSDSWICPSCRLKNTVNLSSHSWILSKLSRLRWHPWKSKLISKSSPPHEDPKSSQYETMTSAAATTISPAPVISASSAVQLIPTHAAPKSQQKDTSPINHNRKFNIVVFKVNECPTVLIDRFVRIVI